MDEGAKLLLTFIIVIVLWIILAIITQKFRWKNMKLTLRPFESIDIFSEDGKQCKNIFCRADGKLVVGGKYGKK